MIERFRDPDGFRPRAERLVEPPRSARHALSKVWPEDADGTRQSEALVEPIALERCTTLRRRSGRSPR